MPHRWRCQIAMRATKLTKVLCRSSSKPLRISQHCRVSIMPLVRQSSAFKPTNHPCPIYELWAFSFPPENLPKSPKWDPQNEFPGMTWTEGFCGNATETLNFSEFPGPSRFRISGSPFSAFWGLREGSGKGSGEQFSEGFLQGVHPKCPKHMRCGAGGCCQVNGWDITLFFR